MNNRASGWAKGIVLATVAGLFLSGCATQYRNHGYVPSEEDLAEIVVGVDTRDSVAEAIGSPSAAGVVSDGGYYYVHSRVRHFAYQRPKVIEREVLAVSFDSSGVVSNIERFGLEDGQVVPLSRRITDTRTTSSSFIQQLLGLLGRVSAADVFE